jgi:hypothetical protein
MDPNDKKSRAIIDIEDDWPWYLRVGASIVNGLPIVFFIVISYVVLEYFSHNPELVANRDLTMNIAMYATVWGILAEVAFLGLVSWFFPYFSHKRVKNSDPIVQAACFLFWGFLVLAGAIIIAAGIR